MSRIRALPKKKTSINEIQCTTYSFKFSRRVSFEVLFVCTAANWYLFKQHVHQAHFINDNATAFSMCVWNASVMDMHVLFCSVSGFVPYYNTSYQTLVSIIDVKFLWCMKTATFAIQKTEMSHQSFISWLTTGLFAATWITAVWRDPSNCLIYVVKTKWVAVDAYSTIRLHSHGHLSTMEIPAERIYWCLNLGLIAVCG